MAQWFGSKILVEPSYFDLLIYFGHLFHDFLVKMDTYEHDTKLGDETRFGSFRKLKNLQNCSNENQYYRTVQSPPSNYPPTIVGPSTKNKIQIKLLDRHNWIIHYKEKEHLIA